MTMDINVLILILQVADDPDREIYTRESIHLLRLRKL